MPLFEDDFWLARQSPACNALSPQSADLKGESLLLLEERHCLRDHALEACKLRDSQVSLPYQHKPGDHCPDGEKRIGLTLLPGMVSRPVSSAIPRWSGHSTGRRDTQDWLDVA